MQILNGKYTSAKIFTDTMEEYALAQLQMLVDHPAFQGSQIRIMPDVHPGKVGTIGFTATVTERILPSVVGNDIGCGMTLAKLKHPRKEFQKLDVVIREAVPSGASLRKKPHRFCADFDLARLLCAEHMNVDRTARSLGTLGGGNHFIELDQDENGDLYVVIHSGSRHLGSASTGKMIIRKGAISAKKGETVIIPINMRDGVILGTGLGNEDWNCSAPHGAGRVMKRQDVMASYTVAQYKKEMKGVYSSCIGKGTLDEAPFAYRSMEQIAEAVAETVNIDKILKPVYNFKAGGEVS